MRCLTCGGEMSGDGYQVVFHCENVDIMENTPEPDAEPVFCKDDTEDGNE